MANNVQDLEAEFMEVVLNQVEHSFSAQSIAECVLVTEPINVRLIYFKLLLMN